MTEVKFVYKTINKRQARKFAKRFQSLLKRLADK